MNTRYAMYFIRPNGAPEPMLTIHSIETANQPIDGTSTPDRKAAERMFVQHAEAFQRGDFPGIVEIALYEEPHGILIATTNTEVIA